ncbi:MAG: EAL domain-containing response regulator, partial [Rhodospirillaceae bacterium]
MNANRLLVIDDDQEIADFVSSVGQMSGFEAQTACNGADFEKTYNAWIPTAIVLDLQMPGVNGIDIIRSLANKSSKSQIIVMSGVDLKIIESVRLLGLSYGLNIASVIQKPVRAADLQEIFSEIIGANDIIDFSEIQTAIDDKQFRLVFQPKVELTIKPNGSGRRKTAGFEALLRWHHPRRGILAPGKFIPLAEISSFMDDLTLLVITKAVNYLKQWRQEGLTTSISLNISSKNLGSDRFADHLVATCKDTGVPPGAVIIELTESAAMSDPIRAMDILTRLRLKGFRLSMPIGLTHTPTRCCVLP